MGMRANGRHSARVETVSAASAAQPPAHAAAPGGVPEPPKHVFSAVCQNPDRLHLFPQIRGLQPTPILTKSYHQAGLPLC